jgi:hypothetical protein
MAKVLTEQMFEQVMVHILRAIAQETDARLAALEERLSEFAFKGTWSEGTRYKKRNLVSMGGAIYYCNVESTDGRPGVSPDWALLVPKAKDGRDGRDAGEPPEPRTVNTARASQNVVVSRRP